MKKILIRSAVILAWISFLFAALYWPKVKFIRYESNSINVFAWGDVLNRSVITEFEKETGIQVNLNNYASNEELLTKLKATEGEGYDLVIPSDYAVRTLIEEKLLKKLDRSKLPFWNQINPNLLGHFFDPLNHYSLPFGWEVYLFGINKDYFAERPFPSSWQLIFDKKIIDYKISMTNDPIEAVLFADFYLFGPNHEPTPEQIQQIRNLLIEQKKWVEVYANFRGDYFLATGNCPIAVASSSYIRRSMKLFSFIDYIIPREGTFIAIENLAIPKLSTKDHLTYQFINYLFRKSSVQTHFETLGFFPSTPGALEDLSLDAKTKALIFTSEEQFKKFHFTREIMPAQQIHDTWIEVKSGKY